MSINAISQIKIALMDTGTPSLLETAAGGLITYSDLLTHHGNDVEAAIRHGAQMLGAYFAQQPSSVGSGGESVSWASRVAYYEKLASGKAGRTTGLRGLHVGGAGLDPMFTRGALGTDPTLDEGAADAA